MRMANAFAIAGAVSDVRLFSVSVFALCALRATGRCFLSPPVCRHFCCAVPSRCCFLNAVARPLLLPIIHPLAAGLLEGRDVGALLLTAGGGASAGGAAPAAAAGGAAAAPAKEEKKKSSSEESAGGDMGFSLFD
jgi:hypothetical protein